MIFFIKYQAQRLNKYTEIVGTKKKYHPDKIVIPEVRQALDEVNNQHCRFRLATKTFLGKVKSFLPGTAAFTIRRQYAASISAAFANLLTLERYIDIHKLKQAQHTNNDKKLRSTQSAPDFPTLPKVYPRIFTKPFTKDDSGVQVQYTSRYPIRVYAN